MINPLKWRMSNWSHEEEGQTLLQLFPRQSHPWTGPPLHNAFVSQHMDGPLDAVCAYICMCLRAHNAHTQGTGQRERLTWPACILYICVRRPVLMACVTVYAPSIPVQHRVNAEGKCSEPLSLPIKEPHSGLPLGLVPVTNCHVWVY